MEMTGKVSVKGPAICAGCAQAGTSCCVNRHIYVTAEDIHRIRQATGEKDFTVLEAVSGPYAEQGDDPAWSQYVLANRERRVLKRREDGSCHFLGQEGCVMDLATRPILCRLYPYEYAEKGIQGLDGQCPVSRSGDPDGDLKEMGMAPGCLEAWHRQLYQEIRIPLEEGGE